MPRRATSRCFPRAWVADYWFTVRDASALDYIVARTQHLLPHPSDARLPPPDRMPVWQFLPVSMVKDVVRRSWEATPNGEMSEFLAWMLSTLRSRGMRVRSYI